MVILSEHFNTQKWRAECTLFTYIQLSVSATVSISYYSRQQGVTVFTHLYVNRDSAERLFGAFAPKPLEEGQSGLVTFPTFSEHFREMGSVKLNAIDAFMEDVRRDGLYVLRFDGYLAHIPQRLIDLNIDIVQAEIVRFNNAPTRARAGYYEDPKTGFVATVEHVFPVQYGKYNKPSAPLYAQNIKVSGPNLAAVQNFNTGLCTGSYNRFLVNAFE